MTQLLRYSRVAALVCVPTGVATALSPLALTAWTQQWLIPLLVLGLLVVFPFSSYALSLSRSTAAHVDTEPDSVAAVGRVWMHGRKVLTVARPVAAGAAARTPRVRRGHADQQPHPPRWSACRPKSRLGPHFPAGRGA